MLSKLGTGEVKSDGPQATTGRLVRLFGRGQKVSRRFELAAGLPGCRCTHRSDASFAIRLPDEDGDKLDLVGNEVGEHSGSTAARTR